MRDLLDDIKVISEDYGLKDPPISKPYWLEIRLTEKYGDAIDFHLLANPLVVHSSAVNPLSYSAATIQGHGLRETDLTREFFKADSL